MDDLERRLDQTGSSFEKALLLEGRAYQGPEGLHDKTLVALGLAGTTGLAAGGGLGWLAGKLWTAKTLLALSASTLFVAVPVAYLVLHLPGKSEGNAAVVMSPPALPMPAPPPTAPLPPEVALATSPSPQVALAAMPERSPTHLAATRPNSALRAELAALDAVRSKVASYDTIAALALLDTYFRTYPRGHLRLEAEVLRIDALAKGRQASAARQYAQEFLRRHPNSLLAPRVRSYANP